MADGSEYRYSDVDSSYYVDRYTSDAVSKTFPVTPQYQKWEYHVQPVAYVHLTTEELNQWGERGWELCSITEGVAYTQYTFKRPKTF